MFRYLLLIALMSVDAGMGYVAYGDTNLEDRFDKKSFNIEKIETFLDCKADCQTVYKQTISNLIGTSTNFDVDRKPVHKAYFSCVRKCRTDSSK